MANLPKHTLSYNDKKESWDLRNDKSDRLLKSFETKADAKAGGVLKKALGAEGGSVKIQKQNGRYEEERTYPRSADPRKSKG